VQHAREMAPDGGFAGAHGADQKDAAFTLHECIL
jgi:hypothetical protein